MALIFTLTFSKSGFGVFLRSELLPQPPQVLLLLLLFFSAGADT